jgi:hypothetical protein
VILIFKHHFLVLMDPVFRSVGVGGATVQGRYGGKGAVPTFIEKVLYIS